MADRIERARRAAELIKKATGEGLNEDHFIGYIKEKYGALYGISL